MEKASSTPVVTEKSKGDMIMLIPFVSLTWSKNCPIREAENLSICCWGVKYESDIVIEFIVTGVTPLLANTIVVLNVNDGIVPDAKTGFSYISRCVIKNVTASPMVNVLKSLNQFPMQLITLIGPEKEKPPSAPKYQNSQGRRRWVTPIKWYPVLLISQNAQIGNETGLRGQSRAQRQGDFNDNSPYQSYG